MSSPEPLRRWTSRTTRQTEPARRALRRARLTVVPQKIEQAARVPFLALVSLMALLGVVTLLMFNTSLQQGSFAASALQEKSDTLTAREEGLKLELEQLRNPQRVAEAAQRQGMVIPTSPDFLYLADGRVVAAENPEPGTGLQLQEPPAARPAELNPPPAALSGNDGSDRGSDRGNDRSNDRGNDRNDRNDRGDNHRGDTDRGSRGSGNGDGRNGGRR